MQALSPQEEDGLRGIRGVSNPADPKRRSALRRVAAALIVLGTLLAAAPSAHASGESDQDHAREYALKGAMLEKFLKYVEWPAEALGEEGAPLLVGVFGKDPFGASLDKMFQGKVHQDHPVRVVRVTKLEEVAKCAVLFIPRGEMSKLAKIVSVLRGHSVLLVGEAKGFATLGGTINFYTEDKKLRFEVNPSQAKRDAIKISSSLLKLARIVEDPKK